MKRIRTILFFTYISLIIHCYVLLALGFGQDVKNQQAKKALQQSNSETEVETYLVDTVTTKDMKPKKADISENYNEDSAQRVEKNRRNYVKNNFRLSKQSNPLEILKAEKEEKKKPDDNGTELILPEHQQAKPSESGDYHTPLPDPENPLEVVMDTYGDDSLATMPSEIVDYLKAMRQKIGGNWNSFFPVFQYYQGIIKHGEVVIHFDVDLDGNVVNPVVEKSYGYQVLDQSCMNAVGYSRNFGPIPEKFRDKGKISIRFKFIY